MKKRQAISHLRKRLFEQDERVRIIYEGKVYKMFINEGDGNCPESNGLSEREQKITLREEKITLEWRMFYRFRLT